MPAAASPLPVVVDTDCGVDDAAALWWALTDPRLEVVAVTTVWGNTGPVEAAANVGRILEATGHTEIPVAIGAAGPSAAAPALRSAAFIHGDDGLGNSALPPPSRPPSREPATDLLRRTVGDRPGEVAVVTLGPLTNLASVVASDDGWAGGVKDLVIMGGAVAVQGNALPVGEANIAHDPAAAAVVIGARWRRAPLLVGLDVTLEATLTDAHFELLAQRRVPAAVFLDEPLRFYRTFGGTFTPGECPCHDLVAMMAAADPSLLVAPELPVAIQETPGPAWGQTVVDRRGPFFDAVSIAAGADAVQPAQGNFSPCRVALGVDVDRFRLAASELFGGGAR